MHRSVILGKKVFQDGRFTDVYYLGITRNDVH